MKRIIYLTIASLLLSTLQISAQPKSKLKKVLELKMPKTVDDENCGTRGASVVWHPGQKKYYASFAGNMAYPFGVFDIKGKRLSSDDLAATADVRGLWYNPKTETICGNAYSEGGWFSYMLNEDGIVDNSTVEIEGMNQPDDQSVGTFLPDKNEVLFLNKDHIALYASDGISDESRTIHFGKKAKDPTESQAEETPIEYNYTSVIYTGIKNTELGILNVDKKQIELYDFEKGFLTKILTLPKDAAVETSFNFAYANGIYWLFNIEKRTWIGYK